MRAPSTVLCAALLMISCSPPVALPPPAPASAAPTGSLRALFDSEWEYELSEYPTYASSLGDHRFDDRWPDASPAAFERRAAHDREVLARLAVIDPAGLPHQDRVSFELFKRERELRVEGQPFRLWHLVLDQRDGVQSADDLADALRFTTLHDYEAWIGRLRALPAYLDQVAETLRQGMAEHIVQPRIAMERVPAQLDKQLVDDPDKSPFFAPLRRWPASLPTSDRDRLVAEARTAIRDGVVPAYRRFRELFVKEYLPACFAEVGAWQLPHGEQAYAYLARLHTTTRLTPLEIHDVGLREVARIRGEMLALAQQIGFKGSLADFFTWLRTDPQFFYPDGPSLFEAYAATAKRVDPLLVRLFRTLPRTPYGVEAIPDAMAPDTTTAYYREPAADGSRAGTFFVNLYQPGSRPRWEMMALTLHESVPGHHLQIALASEQEGLPDFRRHASWTAYQEGWGLYAESLGDELGLYDDPYSRFGRLAYQMWRAVRLVVDTGMHAMHWDRQRAIDYFLSNAPKTELDVINEIDRYIAWPGQALAYKIGELEIQRLRKHAQAELGDRFDVRAFHDVVLRDGAMPLDVLARQVDDWIVAQKR
jgi:uncharacterized protein (DUF885 family)